MSKFPEQELFSYSGYVDENPRVVVFRNNIRDCEENSTLCPSILYTDAATQLAESLNSSLKRNYGSFVATPIFTQRAVEEIIKIKENEFAVEMAKLQRENDELRSKIAFYED